jgi:hypothetical protein
MSRNRARRVARRAGAALAVLLAGVTLAGCVAMPGSGPVQRVDSSQRSEGDSQVRVWGVSPQEGMSPLEIVRGFLEATTSDEVDFETAKKYLTPERQRQWDPFHGTTVLSTGPALDTVAAPPLAGGETQAVTVSGQQVAAVDAAHVYTPLRNDYVETFELRLVRGEWRIDDLPDGLVMGEADFERNYRSVDTYYYTDLGPEDARVTNGRGVLVADPVYVRRRINTVQETVRSLLDGPSAWLGPVVTTAFPEEAEIASGRAAYIDDSDALTVRFSGIPAGLPQAQCDRMAAQLLHTVQEVSSTQISEARVANQAGTQLCALSAQDAEELAPGLLDGQASQAYALTEERTLAAFQGEERPEPVSGALGRGEVPLRDAAVSRDEKRAAGVSADGSSLYVSPVEGSDPLGEPVYARSLSDDGDPGLTGPSWDGLGDLWFADGSHLMRMRDGQGEPERVPVAGLGEDQRIEALRVASDGVRVAMLISEGERTTLRLGRIERAAGEEGVSLAVDGLRAVTPQLEHVSAASWAAESRLVVVGRPRDGVEQLQFVTTDGSTPTVTTALPGLNDVTGVAACESDSQPLLAQTADGIARLEDSTQWKLVPGDGSGPFYPG